MITPEKVTALKKLVSSYTGVENFEELNSTGEKMTKKRSHVLSRYLVMFCLAETTKMSGASIGDQFDLLVDQATVLHAKKAMRNLMDTDRKFHEIISDLLDDAERLINGSGVTIKYRQDPDVISQIESYFLVF
jgi:chromosomal replication initiation ATPase DnaA